jgi:hypothetical protein
MNAKALFAVTVAIALLSGAVVTASDAAQFENASSTLAHAEAKADLARSKADGSLRGVAETHRYFQTAPMRMPSRDEVRPDAGAAGREPGFKTLDMSA